ncbi:MAG: hypothetical protein GY788_28795 [bacterium]|nr:hypothetical protein [bacterium]
MIVWKETAPDFRRRPVGELLPALPFMAAFVVSIEDFARGATLRVLRPNTKQARIIRPMCDDSSRLSRPS